jgi:hypothetical protein
VDFVILGSTVTAHEQQTVVYKSLRSISRLINRNYDCTEKTKLENMKRRNAIKKVNMGGQNLQSYNIPKIHGITERIRLLSTSEQKF